MLRTLCLSDGSGRRARWKCHGARVGRAARCSAAHFNWLGYLVMAIDARDIRNDVSGAQTGA